MQYHLFGRASTPTQVRPLLPGMRMWFLGDSVLVSIAGIQLYMLTEYTDRFFAWTITPPLTAAFLGASYWASLPLVYLAARQTSWAQARLAVFGVLVFTLLTLVATLLHWDRFHFFDPDPTASIAAWMWIVVYAVVPPALLILVILQLRVPGSDPSRQAPLPRWVRLVLDMQALAMLVLGVALFIAPVAPLWAWELTPLTGRAVGAWLVGIGVIAAHASWENDWERVHGMIVGYVMLACLQLLALVRYSATVDWSKPHAALYLIFLMSILVVGGYGWFATRQAHIRQHQGQLQQ